MPALPSREAAEEEAARRRLKSQTGESCEREKY